MKNSAMVKQTEIKKIGVLSLGKIAAALYFLFGVLSALLILVLKKVAANITIPVASLSGLEQLTPGMILIIPLWQALIGFVAGIIVAFLYNILAKKIGGIKIQI